MKKKYQVFISSTYTDLIEERKAILNAILNIHQFPVGMEQFSASDSEQWDVIKEEIDASDYYVLVLGRKYGSVVAAGEDAGISFTEKEFNYAQSKGIPILAFIKSDDADYKPSAIEADPDKKAKLEAFTTKVKTGRIVKWFDNVHQLATAVTAALHNEMEKNNRPGWVRGDQIAVESKIDELISLLKEEYGFDESDNEQVDPDEPVSEYVFEQYRTPTDGKHKQVNNRGDAIAEGEWKNGKFISGIEFDWLIHVTSGELIFKPDCPEDPYDSSEDFDYEKMEQYGWRLYFSRPFGASETYIEEEGLDGYYVVDMEVKEKTEYMFNIRTLEEFLNEKEPEHLEFLKELIEMGNE